MWLLVREARRCDAFCPRESHMRGSKVRWPALIGVIAAFSLCVSAGWAADEGADEGLSNLVKTSYLADTTVSGDEVPVPPGCCMVAPDCGGCEPLPAVCPQNVCLGPPWFAYGWLDQGFTANFDSPYDRFNGPLAFNDRSNDYQVNQLYLTMGREVDRCRCWYDLGGRVDLLYGTDYFFTQARGLETHLDGSPKWNSGAGPRDGGNAALYGLAMPQLFAELFVPLHCGMTVKFGHFYSPVGYEAVQAPENFFYSHSYTKVYGEPFTHTGVVADWDVNPCLSITAGLTNGWNNFDDNNGKLAFLGGATWTSCDGGSTLAFQLHTGPEDVAGEDHNRTVYSLIYTRPLTCRLYYVFQHDMGYQQNGALRTQDGNLIDARWYSICQYLYCRLNCCTDLGLRVEWFRDQQNARVLAIPIDEYTGGNYVAVTLGLNWRPHPRLRFRPEFRWDHCNTQGPGVDGMYDAFRQKDQVTLAIDLIALF
jgi:hypothetical protein